jgi:hypothetical protein
MPFVFAAMVILSLVAGFAAGLVTFKRSLRWCALCGTTLTCPVCAARRLAAGSSRTPAGAAR